LIQFKRLFPHRLAEALGDFLALLQGAVGQHHQKFLAANPADYIVRA
jgi:hypothetical protein